jgi:ABC-type transport system involved in multi-copper enzyme maturation permease subunit
MRKILAIAWKEVYVRFTNRNLVLLMILTPIALSTIIGLAFSQIGDNDIPIKDIPIAVLNLDQGNAAGIKAGDVFLRLLVPGFQDANGGDNLADCYESAGSGQSITIDQTGENSLYELTDAVVFDLSVADELIDSARIGGLPETASELEYLVAAAKSAVDAGIYAAAIVIPPDFSEKVSYIPIEHPEIEESRVLVYADGARQISGGIVHSIAVAITNQIISGNINLAATFSSLASRLSATPSGGAAMMNSFSVIAPCAFAAYRPPIHLAIAAAEGITRQNVTLDIFVRFGSAQAMFFGLFTAGFGVLSMYDERRNWTLQRLLISPTPRSAILSGKLAGVFLTVLFQITLLLIAMTVVASVVVREPVSIWGDEVLKVVLVTLSAAFAVTGFGTFIAGIARTPEQGQIFNTVFALALAVLGGSFGFVLPPEIAQLSMIYWGRTAFESLSASSGPVLTNILILTVQGAILFALGLILFRRRFEMTDL